MKPKYNREWAKAQYDQTGKLEYVFFWAHVPKEAGTVDASCLSPWYQAPFVSQRGIIYVTLEHWMQQKKAMLFDDYETGEDILMQTSPKEARYLARRIRGYDEQVWQANMYRIALEGNLEKFSCRSAMHDFLLSTEDKILVEASAYDGVWGIGLDRFDPLAHNPHTWKGENLLGFTLMEVRDRVRMMRNPLKNVGHAKV